MFAWVFHTIWPAPLRGLQRPGMYLDLAVFGIAFRLLIRHGVLDDRNAALVPPETGETEDMMIIKGTAKKIGNNPFVRRMTVPLIIASVLLGFAQGMFGYLNSSVTVLSMIAGWTAVLCAVSAAWQACELWMGREAMLRKTLGALYGLAAMTWLLLGFEVYISGDGWATTWATNVVHYIPWLVGIYWLFLWVITAYLIIWISAVARGYLRAYWLSRAKRHIAAQPTKHKPAGS